MDAATSTAHAADSPTDAPASSPSDGAASAIGASGTVAAGPATCAVDVIALNRSASTATVSLAGVAHRIDIDIDSTDGTVRPAWWLMTDDGLLGAHEDTLIEVLSDALTAQLRDEAA